MQKEINLFYADDDRDDINFFKDAVTAANKEANVVARVDGGDLLHLLHNPPPKPAIIFLDWNMPGKDGAYVLKNIRENESTMHYPVVILSTSDNQDNIDKAKELGANLYITKPESFRELVNAIKYCLAIDWHTFSTGKADFYYNLKA